MTVTIAGRNMTVTIIVNLGFIVALLVAFVLVFLLSYLLGFYLGIKFTIKQYCEGGIDAIIAIKKDLSL